MTGDKVLRRYINQIKDAIKNGNQGEMTRLLKREQDNQFRQDRYVSESNDPTFKPPFSLNYLMENSNDNSHEFFEIADKELTIKANNNLRNQQNLQVSKQIVDQAIEMLPKPIDQKIVRLRFEFDTNLCGISLKSWIDISKELANDGIKLSPHAVANHYNKSIKQLQVNINKIVNQKYPKVKDTSVFLGFHTYSDSELSAWELRMQDSKKR